MKSTAKLDRIRTAPGSNTEYIALHASTHNATGGYPSNHNFLMILIRERKIFRNETHVAGLRRAIACASTFISRTEWIVAYRAIVACKSIDHRWDED